MPEENKCTLLTLNKVVWNSGDISRIEEFIHEALVAGSRPQGSLRQGLEAAREMVRGAHETFDDFHEEMHDVVAVDNRVDARFTISGRQVGHWGVLPATGKTLHYEEMAIFHSKEGKIAYPRGIVDTIRALYPYGRDAPEENPPSPRTNPEITRLQQGLQYPQSRTNRQKRKQMRSRLSARLCQAGRDDSRCMKTRRKACGRCLASRRPD